MQIELPSKYNASDLSVKITSTDILVKNKEQVELINKQFYAEIKFSESLWSLEEGRLLILELEKKEEDIWKSAFKNGKEIDTSKVENSKKIDEFDGETQGVIRKALYDQQVKRKLGLLPSPEIPMNN